MNLTKEQVAVLEDVFNYAFNQLEEMTKDCAIFQEENGTWRRFNKKKKEKEMLNLWDYFKKNIKIVEGNNESNS